MERSMGILINGRTIRKYLRNDQEREHLDLYHKYALAMNIQVFFIQPEDVQMEEGKTKAYYFNQKMELLNRVIPLPKVIHNRSINLKSVTINKVRKLRSQKISILFNPIGRFSLVKATRILQTNEELLPFLPKIQVMNTNTQEPLMVREKTPFPTWKGHPYVIHTGFQKDENGKWNLSGMIGLLYPSKSIKTQPQPFSLTQMADDYSELIRNPKFELMKVIGLKSAAHLEAFLPQLSDISFDFVISPTGDLLLFDICLMERRELYYGAKEFAMWENSYKKPIAYGKFLLQQQFGGHANE